MQPYCWNPSGTFLISSQSSYSKHSQIQSQVANCNLDSTFVTHEILKHLSSCVVLQCTLPSILGRASRYFWAIPIMWFGHPLAAIAPPQHRARVPSWPTGSLPMLPRSLQRCALQTGRNCTATTPPPPDIVRCSAEAWQRALHHIWTSIKTRASVLTLGWSTLKKELGPLPKHCPSIVEPFTEPCLSGPERAQAPVGSWQSLSAGLAIPAATGPGFCQQRWQMDDKICQIPLDVKKEIPLDSNVQLVEKNWEVVLYQLDDSNVVNRNIYRTTLQLLVIATVLCKFSNKTNEHCETWCDLVLFKMLD